MKWLFFISVIVFSICALGTNKAYRARMLLRDTVPTGAPQLFGAKNYEFKNYVLVDSFIMNRPGDTNNIPYWPALKFKRSDMRWYVYDSSSWKRMLYANDTANFNQNLQQVTDRGSKTTDTITAGGLRTGYIFGDTADQDDFEIDVFPDIQGYTVNPTLTPIAHSMFDWVVANRTTENIIALLQVGDLTSNSTTDEWNRVDTLYDKIDAMPAPQLAYSAVPGNHDYDEITPTPARNTTKYNTYMGPARFVGKSFYGSNFQGKNDNYYIKFKAGIDSFMVINLELYPRDSALNWAQSVLDSFPSHKAIMMTHGYITAFGEKATDTSKYTTQYNLTSVGNYGQAMWDKLFKKNKQVIMTLNGHFIYDHVNPALFLPWTKRITEAGLYGNVVNQIGVNYQSDTSGGNGYFMRLKFKPRTGKIDVSFFSPYRNQNDPRFPSYTLNYPAIKIDAAVGISGVNGSLSVAGEARFDSSVAFTQIPKNRILISGLNGKVDTIYNDVTGKFFVSNGIDQKPSTRYITASDVPTLANNGLSKNGDTTQLGQAVGATGNPSKLLVNREIISNAFTLDFKDSTTKNHTTIGSNGITISDTNFTRGIFQTAIQTTNSFNELYRHLAEVKMSPTFMTSNFNRVGLDLLTVYTKDGVTLTTQGSQRYAAHQGLIRFENDTAAKINNITISGGTLDLPMAGFYHKFDLWPIAGGQRKIINGILAAYDNTLDAASDSGSLRKYVNYYAGHMQGNASFHVDTVIGFYCRDLDVVGMGKRYSFFQGGATDSNYFAGKVRLPNVVAVNDTTSYKPTVFDANGNVFKMTGWPATVTTLYSGDGTLPTDRTVTGGANGLTFTSTRTGTNSTLTINNSSSGRGLNVSSGAGIGVRSVGTTGIGVQGVSDDNYGLWGQSTTVPGLYVLSSAAHAADFTTNPASTNTVVPIINLYRTAQSAGANNIGGSIDFYLNNTASAGNTVLANQIISQLPTATATSEESRLVLKGVTAGAASTMATFDGNGNATFGTTNSIVGTTGTETATAGNIGEVFSSTVSTYTNYTTTATYQNIASITLTAGDWDISAQGTFSSNGATITAASDAIFVISTTTASAAGATEGKNIAYVPQAALLGTSHESITIAPFDVHPSTSTTYYYNTQAAFSIGNPQFVGTIRARRIR